MTFRATRVKLHNETQHTLELKDSTVVGEWTEKWAPPATIAPFSVGQFRSENDYVLTGTGGSATYRISSGGSVRLSWSNPAAGLAHYEQECSDTAGIYFEGGKGDDADVDYHLIPSTRRAVAGFLPSRQGFHFGNSWPGVPVVTLNIPTFTRDISVPVSNASQGLCGGMACHAIDYFTQGLWAPIHEKNPEPGGPLFASILNRQQSILVDDPEAYPLDPTDDLWRMIGLTNPIYPRTDSIFAEGSNWIFAHRDWPAIRRHVDGGRPALVTLLFGDWTDGSLGHQVAVYAYRLVGQELTMWCYDPNTPATAADPHADKVRITVDISRTDLNGFRYDYSVDIPGHPKIHSVIDTTWRYGGAPAGREPEPEVVLTSVTTAGQVVDLDTGQESIQAGCMKNRPGEHYTHTLRGASAQIVITAHVSTGSPVAWKIKTQEIPTTAGGVPVSGVRGRAGDMRIHRFLTSQGKDKIGGLTALATDTTLTIDVAPDSGNFSIDVEAFAVGARSPQKITVGSNTVQVVFDEKYLERLRRCAETYSMPLTIEPIVSDPPWDDIFGPGVVIDGPMIPGDPTIFRRRAQRDVVLSSLAKAEQSPERDIMVSGISRLFF